MEKRRLISLRSVLLQYLVRTALACLLVAVGWLLVLMLWIQNGGLFLPANQAAQACQKAAQDVLPGMTAATFDETQLDSLCRYALFAAPDSSEVLATNTVVVVEVQPADRQVGLVEEHELVAVAGLGNLHLLLLPIQ